MSPSIKTTDHPHRFYKMAVWIWAAAVFFIFPYSSPAAGLETTNSTSLTTNAAVEQAIKLSGDYLKRACNRNGKFLYEIDMDSGDVSSDYNMVRHAGAIYALAMLNQFQPDDKAVDAMTRASQFMQRYIAPPSGDADQSLTVWSTPYRTTLSQSSLGATGLGLVALVGLSRADSSSVPDGQLEALARFAISLQKDDGSFFSTYNLETGATRQGESLYYPGETALGLISLYELDHTNEWLTSAAKALACLAKSRAGVPGVPPDHWSLIATAKLWPYYDASHCPVSREILLRHAEQICEGILAEQITSSPNPEHVGGFDKNGRTTPTATRLEGLLAALEFIPSDQTDLRSRIQEAVQSGIDFLLRAQVKSGRYAGGMPGAVTGNNSDPQEQDFGTRAIRIDYVQHALCAWIRYDGFLRHQSN